MSVRTRETFGVWSWTFNVGSLAARNAPANPQVLSPARMESIARVLLTPRKCTPPAFPLRHLSGLLHWLLHMSNDGNFMRVVVLLLAISAGAQADVVQLKTGEMKKGKIIKETADEITMLVSVTATIKDDLVIKKSDIKMVEKVSPEEEAWLPLANLSLGQESLDPEDYDNVIGALGLYIERFPESSHVPEANQKIERFQEELKRVEAGELKLDGQWLDRAKVLEERVQIIGRILLNRMRRLASAGQGIEAMQAFEVLEKDFGGSAS